MHDDDEPVGRVLSRRQALAVLGGVTGAGLAIVGAGVAFAGTSEGAPRGAGAPSAPVAVDCVAKPEAVEGPYFVDERLERSDIRSDTATGQVKAGTPFALTLQLLRVDQGCVPLPGAQVDIWQCDAAGIYSDIAVEGTTGQDFLRGYQVTDRFGRVRFGTVLPGWYSGRAVHIHLKIRTTGADGNPYEFTSQLYLPEEFTAAYLATGPYAAHGQPDTVNSTDRIFSHDGDQMVLAPQSRGRGYTATFTVGLDLTDTAAGADDVGGGIVSPPPSTSPSQPA